MLELFLHHLFIVAFQARRHAVIPYLTEKFELFQKASHKTCATHAPALIGGASLKTETNIVLLGPFPHHGLDAQEMKAKARTETAKILRYHKIVTICIRGRHGRVQRRIGTGFQEDRHETFGIHGRRPFPRYGDNPFPDCEHRDRDNIVQVHEFAGHILPESVVKVEYPPLHWNPAYQLFACPLRETMIFSKAEHLNDGLLMAVPDYVVKGPALGRFKIR